MARTAIITLTTDFGLNDHFIGAMKGVILEIAPEAQIVDISHAVQPFDILDGALTISQAYSYFPSGTVHMVIVDPGVGTARRPVILTGDRHLFVAPDNGVLSLVYDREERISVRHVTAEHYFLQPRSNTFHARDIFSPVAAYLAKGVEPDRFGDEITDYVRFGAPRPKPVDERTLRGSSSESRSFWQSHHQHHSAGCAATFRGRAARLQDRDWNQGAGNAHVHQLRRRRSRRGLWNPRQHGVSGSRHQPGISLPIAGRGQRERSQCGDGVRGSI